MLVSVLGTRTDQNQRKLNISCRFGSFIPQTRFLSYCAQNEFDKLISETFKQPTFKESTVRRFNVIVLFKISVIGEASTSTVKSHGPVELKK